MSIIQGFLDTLPKSIFAFTYGSSYLIAPSGKDTKAQIDLVLCVEDAVSWHDDNLKKNPSHYAYQLRFLGSSYIVNSSQKAAKIHYNPYISHNDFTYKYGVINFTDLVEDLNHWSTFYLAGRMQKPIEVLIPHPELPDLMNLNYKKALITSAMMGPSLFEESDLYEQICQLSYYGDKRLEDPQKVKNIVAGNLNKFKSIYRPLFSEINGLHFDNGFLERTQSFYSNLQLLPEWLSVYSDLPELNWEDRRSFIIKLFKKLNSQTSEGQIMHAIRTTGPLKILKYSLAKLQKSLK